MDMLISLIVVIISNIYVYQNIMFYTMNIYSFYLQKVWKKIWEKVS